jgi:hypothetical protein
MGSSPLTSPITFTSTSTTTSTIPIASSNETKVRPLPATPRGPPAIALAEVDAPSAISRSLALPPLLA